MSRSVGIQLGAYRALSPLLAVAARAAVPFSSKLARGWNGRNGLLERLTAAATDLDGCLWFHAASVGEYEQARPVIAALRVAGYGPLVVTHFSPSGLEYARRHPCADFHDYLPLDTPDAMAQLVDAWHPRCLVCVKYDGWPNQILAAETAGVPVILVSGSLPHGSGRLSPAVRPLFRDVYNRFTCLGVGSEADRVRFVDEMGVTIPVSVTGDTRAEQVIRRYQESCDGDVARTLAAWGGRRIVLGSTWPKDEALWLPVLKDLLAARPELKIVIVPHEPTRDRLEALARDLDSRGLAHGTLTDLESGGARTANCLLVDRVGVLAEIYHAATIAYVGGSFTTGVHSTLEPAVAALPVLFGPRIGNAEEALTMVARGGGFVVTTPGAALAKATALLDDDDLRLATGLSAAEVVADQVGATARSVRLIIEAMGDQR